MLILIGRHLLAKKKIPDPTKNSIPCGNTSILQDIENIFDYLITLLLGHIELPKNNLHESNKISQISSCKYVC